MPPRAPKVGSSTSMMSMVMFGVGFAMMFGSMLILSFGNQGRINSARESLAYKLRVQEETQRAPQLAPEAPSPQPCPACPVLEQQQQQTAPPATGKSVRRPPQELVRISMAKKVWKDLKEVGFHFPKNVNVSAQPPLGPTMDIEGTGLATPMEERAPSGNQTVCIAAVLKGESHSLREWMYHYIREGVTHFYMINNDELYSDEFWRFCEVVAPFIDAGWVTASHYSLPANISAGYNSRINFQVHAITAIALRKSQEGMRHEWMLTVDLDEYMYGVGKETIASILESRHPSISQLCVPWITFTSGSFHFQPPCIAPFFTERVVTPEGKDSSGGGKSMSGKCAVRVRLARQLQNHIHHEYPPNKHAALVVLSVNGSGDVWERTFIGTSRAHSLAPLPRFMVEESNVYEWPIRLNHYMRQSWLYFHKKRSKNTALSTFDYNQRDQDALHNLFYKSHRSPAELKGSRLPTVQDTTLAKKMNWVGLGCVPEKWDDRQSVDVLPAFLSEPQKLPVT